jgi:predicted secreted Zn-dependent protease
MLTGCASPATRTALEALQVLQHECGDGMAASDATCRTLSLIESHPLDMAAGAETAAVLSSTTGGTTDPGREGAKAPETREATERRARRPRRTAERPRQDQVKPRRVSRRIPRVRMPVISASYFGAGVTVARFRITGDTRSQILRSIRTRGPYGGASGVTQPYLKYHFRFKYDKRGRCRIVRTAAAGVTMSVRVTLPRWAASVGTEHSAASWWADELRETAAHERHHVRLWRRAVRQANTVVATSSCRTLGRRLDVVWREAMVANCRFDSSEYGISLKACLRR